MRGEHCRWAQATHVGVTVRTRSFFTQIKTGKLSEVTSDPDVVESGARAVLARFDIQRPVRLLGVRLDLALPECAPSLSHCRQRPSAARAV